MFLLKPHVVGPAGQVTSPDVIVDRVLLNGSAVPVQRVTHDAWLQHDAGDTSTAGYAVMALGGGPLVLPVVVLASGPIVVARRAWRLANFEAHAESVTLNGVALSVLGAPATLIAAVAGPSAMAPRGYLFIRTLSGQAHSATLEDSTLGRRLEHAVVFEPLAAQRWAGGSPTPRYAIGPTKKDVPHFI